MDGKDDRRKRTKPAILYIYIYIERERERERENGFFSFLRKFDFMEVCSC